MSSSTLYPNYAAPTPFHHPSPSQEEDKKRGSTSSRLSYGTPISDNARSYSSSLQLNSPLASARSLSGQTEGSLSNLHLSETIKQSSISPPPQQSQFAHKRLDVQVNDFNLLKTLGTGTFARVWLATLRSDDGNSNPRVYALKVLKKVDTIRLKQVEHIKNERNTLATVYMHPFITNLVGTFKDHNSVYMLLDYCPGGELFTYLRKFRRFSESTARFYAAEILMVLQYLHETLGIVYRDLKPENILLDADGHLKLVDFGFAKKIGRMETYTLCGTPEYLAPEVIRNTGHSLAVDWWAFGILIYEFIVGQPPFWDPAPLNIYTKIVAGHITYPSTLSSYVVDLIKNLCNTNPSERLGNIVGGAERIKSHPWFRPTDWEGQYNKRTKGPIVPFVKGPTDASNFDDYDPPTGTGPEYTIDLERRYEEDFKDF